MALAELLRRLDGILGTAALDGIRILLQPFQLFVGHGLVILILHDGFQVTLAHVVDAVLRKVAVHHRYIVAFHVMQVTCHQHSEGCLPGSSLLCGDSHILGFIHTFDNYYCYT